MVAIYIHGENIYYRTDKNFHFGELRLDRQVVVLWIV